MGAAHWAHLNGRASKAPQKAQLAANRCAPAHKHATTKHEVSLQHAQRREQERDPQEVGSGHAATTPRRVATRTSHQQEDRTSQGPTKTRFWGPADSCDCSRRPPAAHPKFSLGRVAPNPDKCPAESAEFESRVWVAEHHLGLPPHSGPLCAQGVPVQALGPQFLAKSIPNTKRNEKIRPFGFHRTWNAQKLGPPVETLE